MTRDTWPGSDAYTNLRTILESHIIEARSAMGWAKEEAHRLGGAAESSQRVVCFSETPLDSIHSLVADIAGRSIELKPYGLAFTKMVVRRKGANPVWYVDMTPGHTWVIRDALNELKRDALEGGAADFVAHPSSRIFPFVDWMGTWPSGSQKEFWWEREWRAQGNFSFALSEVALVLAPAQHHEALAAAYKRPCIDPSWSMERMVASLVGLGADDVTPFPAAPSLADSSHSTGGMPGAGRTATSGRPTFGASPRRPSASTPRATQSAR